MFIKNKVSLIDIIADIRNKTIISQVKLVLYLLIKDSFLFPFLISKGLDNKLKSDLLTYYLEKSIHLGKSIVGLNSIQVITELNIPCSNSEIKSLIRNSEQIIQTFRNEINQENYTIKRKKIYQNMTKFPILRYIDEKGSTINENTFCK